MFERQLEEYGPASLRKSRRSLSQRLSEHEQKLRETRSTGGHTSLVEHEIGTFQRQIEAIGDVLKGG